MSKLNSTSSFNTLERDLSVILKPSTQKQEPQKQEQKQESQKQKQKLEPQKREQKQEPQKREQKLESKSVNDDKKIKYISVDKKNFVNFYSKGNKAGYNYNTDQENDLRFSESTRRKTINKNTSSGPNIPPPSARAPPTGGENNKNFDDLDDNFITNLVMTDSNLRLNNTISDDNTLLINSNMKGTKESTEYWDNTKRRNLDTAIYTNNPHKIQGRGFGDIKTYDLWKIWGDTIEETYDKLQKFHFSKYGQNIKPNTTTNAFSSLKNTQPNQFDNYYNNNFDTLQNNQQMQQSSDDDYNNGRHNNIHTLDNSYLTQNNNNIL